MKGINLFLFFYISVLIFTNLIFFSCLGFENRYEEMRKRYSLKIEPSNIPVSIKRDLPYKIGIRLYLFDQNLNWSICLASFRSLAFNVTGEICTSKVDEGVEDIYDIELPKNGYIYFTNPDYLIVEYENAIINFCYNYYTLFSLEGCFFKNRICELKVLGTFPVDSDIKIFKAESYYNETDKNFYLRLYLIVEPEEGTYFYSFQNVEKNCFIREYVDRFEALYNVKYFDKDYSSKSLLRVHNMNQITIPLSELKNDIPNLYLEIKFYYNVIKRINLGSIRIEK